MGSRGGGGGTVGGLRPAGAAAAGEPVHPLGHPQQGPGRGGLLRGGRARFGGMGRHDSVDHRAAGQRDAQIIQAEASAQAANIYADAYGKDPKFYDFYRAMQSYRQTFLAGEGQSSMVLSDDSEYFRQFKGNR